MLLSGNTDEAIEVALEAKVNPEQLYLIVERRLKEVKVEYGPYDVLLDAGVF